MFTSSLCPGGLKTHSRRLNQNPTPYGQVSLEKQKQYEKLNNNLPKKEEKTIPY